MFVAVRAQDAAFLDALAELTFHAFRRHAPDWLPTLAAAREEVVESLQPGRQSFAIVDAATAPVGWIAVEPQGRSVWEIHPIVVRVADQGKGHGRALLAHVEQLARAQGILTLFASTSDEVGATSLAGVDLFADPVSAMAGARWQQSHACEFWRRVGFTLVGVLPDAEGPGKPSIHFAKGVHRAP
jgi:aminoglycoside 6'-N-acetyltransferase I